MADQITTGKDRELLFIGKVYFHYIPCNHLWSNEIVDMFLLSAVKENTNYSTTLNSGVLPLVEIDQRIVPVFGNFRSKFSVVQ